jgi:sucrose-6-phosphate hydrolase SacC (GH32 family)
MLVSGCDSKTNKTKSEAFPPEMVRFEPYKGNPVFSGTGTDTWDKKIRERGYILFEDGLYKMWYSGYNREIAKPTFLGYATSTDGINWERYSDKPIFSGKWTEDMIVLKNEGTYYMYAEGDDDVSHLLISSDGINWKEQGDLTILTTKGDTIPGPYGTPTVWIEDGKWYLFYERDDLSIWLAESSDKINWKNIQDEPVIALGPDKYDIAAVAADQVVKCQNMYFLYYHATDRLDWQHPSSHVVWTSNVAMSTDLVHWTKYSGNPFIEGDYSSAILVFDREKPSLYTMHSEVCRFSPK